MNRRNFLTTAAGATAAFSLMTPSKTFAAEAVQKSDGMNYAPQGKPKPVVKKGEFPFAAAFLDHGHIGGMVNGLTEAGATLKWIYEANPKNFGQRDSFKKRFPDAKIANNFDEILNDPEVKLVAAAAVPNLRGPIGCQVMNAGKDYFTDKTPFTEMAQLDEAKKIAEKTGKKYAVYFSERLHTESGMYATDLVKEGVIGKVVQVIGLGPHRLNKSSRPAWFFNRKEYGGILCDIGSHQFEQFLTYAGVKNATVAHAAIANYANPETPELEDFGEATLIGDNGTSNYIRVDWFTPNGLSTWGDGRIIILGTKGYIELRKYLDVAKTKTGDHVFFVNDEGEHYIHVGGKVGFRFFGELILDCLNRTEKAMTQAHTFKAAELCVLAQEKAVWLTPKGY